MKEIKFRVWNKMRGIFIIDGMNPKEIQDDATQSMELPLMTSEDCVWQQYTGLKDKNGVDIYEGDIFNDSDWWVGQATVKFNNGIFGFSDEDNDRHVPLFECKRIEVIGNIFEGVFKQIHNE